MSDFLEHIFQGMISEAEAERIAEKANEEGYEVGYREGYDQAQGDEVEY